MRELLIDPRGPKTRRTALARLGAAIVGASAAAFMATRTAQAGPTPYPCRGLPGCDGGCGSAVTGKCCWYATDSSACRTYYCCDRYDLSPRGCMCRYYVGPFC
jgi:hypothetical protein